MDGAAGELDADAFLARARSPCAGSTTPPPVARAASVAATSSSAEALIQPPALRRFLDLLSEMLGPRLLRVKGLDRPRRRPRPAALHDHGAQHAFTRRVGCLRGPTARRLSRLVVIADGVAPARIEALMGGADSGAPQIDTPDLAALTDNPLAPKVGGLLG